MFDKRLLGAAIAASTFYTQPALASPPSLEEVVVTAQRKEQSLQDAPISITAFDAESLEKFGIEGLGDIGTNVPNLNVRPFPVSNSTLRIKIRGIGTNDTQVTQDPAIGVYINDVYIARATGLAIDTADLRSIEVLKGPQGTLFGRNAVGGAIKMETIPPSTEALEFTQKLTAGNDNFFQSRTLFNLPLTDNIATKAVYIRSQSDGWLDNAGPGLDFYEKHSEGGRFDIRWLATQSFTIDYAYDFSRAEQANPTYQATQLPYNSPNSDYRKGYTGDDGFLTGAQSALVSGPYSEKRLSSLTTLTPLLPTDTAIDGHTVNMNWQLDDFVVKSISSYRLLDEQRYTDLGTGSRLIRIDPNGNRTSTNQDQLSQEFQLQGDASDGRIAYTTGLYYFKEHATEGDPNQRSMMAATIASFAPNETRYYNTFGGSSAKVKNSAWAAYAQGDFIPPILNDQLTITLGLRYTEDRRRATVTTESITWLSTLAPAVIGADSDIVFRQPAVDGEGFGEFENLGYLFVLSYDWNDDINSYFKVSTAYKSGGFNMREGAPGLLKGTDALPGAPLGEEKDIAVTQTFEDGFDEEEVIGYELGIKSELFDRRMRFNLAIFYNEYEDIQTGLGLSSTPSPADTNVFNGGTARIEGFELDITALLTEGLTLKFDYGYTNADFIDAVDPREGASEPNLVFSGAPQNSYTLSLDYEFQPFSFGLLAFNVNYVWQDEVITNSNKNYATSINFGTGEETLLTPEQIESETYSPNISSSDIATFSSRSTLDDYGLLNARLTLSEIPAGQGSFKVALWGKNLEDKQYMIDSIATFSNTDKAVLFGPPRSYGIDLSYEY